MEQDKYVVIANVRDDFEMFEKGFYNGYLFSAYSSYEEALEKGKAVIKEILKLYHDNFPEEFDELDESDYYDSYTFDDADDDLILGTGINGWNVCKDGDRVYMWSITSSFDDEDSLFDDSDDGFIKPFVYIVKSNLDEEMKEWKK